jgi:hypothetical protein
VLAKRLAHLLVEPRDLPAELGDDRDEGLHGGAVGGGEQRPGGELLGAQRGDDPGAGAVEVALPAGGPQRVADLADPQLLSLLRRRRQGEYRQGVAAGEIGAERGQRRGVELAASSGAG